MKDMKNPAKIRKTAAVKYWLAVFIICSSVLLAVCPVSCRMTEEGIEVVPGDKTCPVIEKFDVLESSRLSLCCSEKILISSASVAEGNPENPGNEIPVFDVNYDETGKSADIILKDKTQVGHEYFFSAVISDENGNSVEFTQNFCGFNENPAFLILNEIRPKSDAEKMASDFIEFYCLKGGNTYGLKLCSGAKGADCDYYFPAMEVASGEYITLHNRIFEKEKSINETGDDLDLSTAIESSNSARDLWRDGTDAKIGTSADVIILKNYSTGKIYDGIPYCKSTAKKWGNKLQAEYAELLAAENIWTDGADVSSAFASDKMTTVTRSISRKNLRELYEKFSCGEIDSIHSSANDWALTSSSSGKNSVSGATPGLKNSTVYYSE